MITLMACSLLDDWPQQYDRNQIDADSELTQQLLKHLLKTWENQSTSTIIASVLSSLYLLLLFRDRVFLMRHKQLFALPFVFMFSSGTLGIWQCATLSFHLPFRFSPVCLPGTSVFEKSTEITLLGRLINYVFFAWLPESGVFGGSHIYIYIYIYMFIWIMAMDE